MGSGYDVIWFLYKGRPYDIGRFYRPDGTFTGYYVDILEQVHWEGHDSRTLQPIVDLFLDLWITPEMEHRLLDEEELEEATRSGAVTERQRQHARTVAAELTSRIEAGVFPPPEVTRYAQEPSQLERR